MGATTRKPAASTRPKTPGRDLLDLTTELEAAQARLQSLQHQVECLHAQATLGTIAGMLAHEFNNVLTPVVSYTQMALAHPEDAALSRKALERSLAACEQVTRISASILQFSKSEGGAAHHVPRGTSMLRADVAACVQRALDCLGRDPRKDGIEVRVDAPASVHAAMGSDELVHVLLNALLNARAAIARYSGTIDVRVGASASNDHAREDGRVVITIQDSGRGMTPEQLRQLFRDDPSPSAADDSSQASDDLARSTKRPQTTRGLGTRIMLRLVHAAGGSIAASSSVGQGTRLEITLPRAPQV